MTLQMFCTKITSVDPELLAEQRILPGLSNKVPWSIYLI